MSVNPRLNATKIIGQRKAFYREIIRLLVDYQCATHVSSGVIKRLASQRCMNA